jgi:hypothetical protein
LRDGRRWSRRLNCWNGSRSGRCRRNGRSSGCRGDWLGRRRNRCGDRRDDCRDTRSLLLLVFVLTGRICRRLHASLFMAAHDAKGSRLGAFGDARHPFGVLVHACRGATHRCGWSTPLIAPLQRVTCIRELVVNGCRDTIVLVWVMLQRTLSPRPVDLSVSRPVVAVEAQQPQRARHQHGLLLGQLASSCEMVGWSFY